MEKILFFIRDWIPSIGVIIGGVWLLFKWIHKQTLRRKKDLPALTGEITNEIVRKDNKSLLNIIAEWNNTSPQPIYIDVKNTRFDVYIMKADMEPGPFEIKKDLGEPIFRYYPLEDMGKFIFEPLTKSQLRANFILENGNLYFVRLKVYWNPEKHGHSIFAWTREKLIDLR